ncbi:MAG: DUF4880 domain-containing protein [Bacteroidota bacterium]
MFESDTISHILQFLSGELPQAEAAAFEGWLAESPRHQACYEMVLEIRTDDVLPTPPTFNVTAAWQRIQSHMHPSDT